jgi:putative membrane protein
MYGTDGGWGFGMGLGMWIFWILLVVVIVVLIRVLSGAGNGPAAPSQESPIEILRARYARGEIDEEEFRRRRHELEK